LAVSIAGKLGVSDIRLSCNIEKGEEMRREGEGWCRWRAVLAGLGLLATGASVGVAAANYMHMTAMREHTRSLAIGQAEHIEVARQTLAMIERLAADKSQQAKSDSERREAAAARIQAARLRRRVQQLEEAAKHREATKLPSLFDGLLGNR